MKGSEMIEAVKSVNKNIDLILHSHGNRLVFREVVDGISMMSVRSADDEVIITVPYDKIEEDEKGHVMLMFNDTVRGIMDPKGVNKVWGL